MAQETDFRGKRPSYPKKRTCDCDGQPEWEWQFEDIWACLGCGKIIEGKSGKDPLKKAAPGNVQSPAISQPAATTKFVKGMKVKRTYFGVGGYKEENEDVVDSVKDGVVRTVECENGITFSAKTGKELENFFPGIHQEIAPLEVSAKSSRKKSK